MTICAAGPERFATASAAIQDLRRRLVRSDNDAPFPLLGGFAFFAGIGTSANWREFGDALLIVPAALLQIHNGRAFLRVTLPVEPTASPIVVAGRLEDILAEAQMWTRAPAYLPSQAPGRIDADSRPDRASWEASVAAAVAQIRQGRLDKVVLAREERLCAETAFSPIATLDRLRVADPNATLFAVQAADDWFLGATPERLVRLERGRVDVTCLAGSIGIGETMAERADLAKRLLASAKDREEHEIVVRSTMSALRDVCEDVCRHAGTPRVVAARSVQHLETPVTARLAGAGQVLDLVARLHPTPAVGGFPRDRAMAVIRELEAIERGWYAGPIGWTDIDGAGEFAVAIRSALVRDCAATVYAGCGIVADSDPATEFAETCLKLRPMLSALGAA
jgi:isochorismate synthase